MLDAIRALFTGRPEAESTAAGESADHDPVHVAACALLLDVAYADGEFSPPERAHLETVLARHFGLSPAEVTELLALAHEARGRSVDHFEFTRVLQERYDLGQKMVLAEVLWGLALADGTIGEHEHYLTRKIANLLNLDPGYLATAKAAAASRRPAPDAG
jgi:uncharacterized tellurite resistance protein B-like protein